MMKLAPRSKERRLVVIPDRLRDDMREVWELVQQAKHDPDIRIGYDDAIQVEGTKGDRRDQGGHPTLEGTKGDIPPYSHMAPRGEASGICGVDSGWGCYAKSRDLGALPVFSCHDTGGTPVIRNPADLILRASAVKTLEP